MAKKKEVVKKQEAPERIKYESFYAAWPNVPELRRYTTQEGFPRSGMNAEDNKKAEELIKEYKNG